MPYSKEFYVKEKMQLLLRRQSVQDLIKKSMSEENFEEALYWHKFGTKLLVKIKKIQEKINEKQNS